MKSSERKFDDFKTFNEPVLEKALLLSANFVIRILVSPYERGGMLSLLGISGVGKTMLCDCVWSALRVNKWGVSDAVPETVRGGSLVKFECRKFDMRKVSDKLKSGDWSIVEAIEEPPFVILDDVGADYDPNKIAASKVDRVLRSRIGKWTMLTSNLLLNDINLNLDARIASFIIRDENQFVEIKTIDYGRRK
jgi:DNA replication protein DnaC